MTVDVDRLREVCERYGVVRLEVFGSVGRGTVAAGSDVDLLYTLGADAHLGWAIEDLSAELSALLGKPVDLVSRKRTERSDPRRSPRRSAALLCSGVRFYSSAR
jgi:predicted nucleotidyltransferase